MVFKEILTKLRARKEAKKEKFREMDEDYRLAKMIEDRQKSANERELERFQNEEREENIKEVLEFYRKKKDHDIKFNHNPLDAPNITNHVEWDVLKERNQFTNNKNMFMSKGNIHKSNPKLLKNNRSLFGI